jgi:site-specific recombinase XerD
MPAVLRLPVAVAPLLQDALEAFLMECRLRGLSPATVKWYVWTVGPFLRHVESVGCQRIDEVTEAHVKTFVAGQQTRVQPDRVNQFRKGLRAFFDWALEEGFVAVNPAARLRKLREPKKIISTFSEADVKRLLAQPDLTTFAGLRDHVFILCLCDTGLRLSEALGLRLEDVDLEGLTMKVMGKGSKERLVGFSPAFAARLQKYLMRRALALKGVGLQDEGWVWLTQFGGRLCRRTMQDRLKIHGDRAGLTNVRVSAHTCRHTHAVHFVRNGGSPFHLQRALGHSTLEMTRRYCELSETDWLDAQRAHSLVTHLNLDPPKRTRLPNSGASAAGPSAERPSAGPPARGVSCRPSPLAPPARSSASSSRGWSARGRSAA